MRNSRFYKVSILLLIEIVTQIGLVLVTEHFDSYSLTLNILVGIIIAIVYMAYWENTREFRLTNLEIKVRENKDNNVARIQELHTEINDTKRELDDLKKRVRSIEKD